MQIVSQTILEYLKSDELCDEFMEKCLLNAITPDDMLKNINIIIGGKNLDI